MRRGNSRGVFSWRAAGTGREEAAPKRRMWERKEEKCPALLRGGRRAHGEMRRRDSAGERVENFCFLL